MKYQSVTLFRYDYDGDGEIILHNGVDCEFIHSQWGEETFLGTYANGVKTLFNANRITQIVVVEKKEENN